MKCVFIILGVFAFTYWLGNIHLFFPGLRNLEMNVLNWNTP